MTDVITADFIAIPPPPVKQPRPRKTPKHEPARVRIITWATAEAPPAGRRGKFIEPEYDLTEIGKATDTDGLFRIAYDRHLTCIMKEGWSINGRNPVAVSYIRRRLREIGYMSGSPFSVLLRQMAQDLVEYSNFFLFLHRDEEKSTGQGVVVKAKKKKPIAALFNLDPPTMVPRIGDTINIRSWHQLLPDTHFHGKRFFGLSNDGDVKNSKRYMPEDIVHGFWRRRTGQIFGTPTAVPVLDDIRALRRLEEIAELITHKHAFPLVHVTVGTENMPARRTVTGTPEVDVIAGQYENMPLEGSFVTSERVSVTGIRTESMDLKPLLEHYHDRAMSGLGISSIDIGRGDSANRGTAITLSRNLMDRCREFQAILSEYLTEQLFDILLLEGGFDLDEDTRVTLEFPEVDIERQMVVNNHAMALYQGNVFTETEARAMMGRDPLTESQRDDLFMDRVSIPLAKEEAEASMRASVRAAASKNTPTNQSGKKRARTQAVNTKKMAGERASQEIAGLLTATQDDLRIYMMHQESESRVIDDRELRRRLSARRDSVRRALVSAASPLMQAGMDRYAKESGSQTKFFVGKAIRDRFVRRCLSDPLNEFLSTDPKVSSDVNRMVDTLRSSTGGYNLLLGALFDNWSSRWRRLLDRLEKISEAFGYAQAAWIDDANDLKWEFKDDPCERCVEVRGDVVTPAAANYYGLLPRDCEAQLVVVQGDKLPARLNLEVDSKEVPGGMEVDVNIEGKESLDLTGADRFITIVLDSGKDIVLPQDTSDDYTYDGKNTVRLPMKDSGMVELWDSHRCVGRARIDMPNGRH